MARNEPYRQPLRYKNLQEFIATLEAHGELIRIGEICSPDLEISALTDLAAKSPGGGKALFFERVTGSGFPVLTNAFGSDKRIALALGTNDLDALAKRMKDILEQKPPRGLREIFRFLKQAAGWARYLPRLVKMSSPPCQEVVARGEEVDLRKLPVLRTWPADAAPFVTLPVVFTRSLETGKRNAGMYRLQIFDRNTTGMHWHIHKDGAHYFHEYRKAGRKMEVAVAIGTEPAVTYAATAPLPRGLDEMLLAGFIRQAPVRMVKCLTVDLEVPAEAEIILEGYVDPEERRTEGPFGDHTGYYSPADLYPVLHVTAVTHRKDAIYSATVVGRPPMEDCYLAKATERLFLPLLKTIMPEVRDYWLPWEGVFHNLLVISIEKTYPRQAWKVIQGLWGSGQMSVCKAICVVDQTIDLKDRPALISRLLKIIDWKRDVMITEGILDVLDHAAPQPCFGGKLGLDLTEPGPGEEERTVLPRLSRLAPEALRERIKTVTSAITACRVLFPDQAHNLLLCSVNKPEDEPGGHLVQALLKEEILPVGTVAVLLDRDNDLDDNSLLLWRVANNVDPRRDIYISENRTVINALRKGPADGYFRPWPDDVVMEEEVAKKAREKASRWGII